jgi:polyhydroxybutyrate depolymerase
MQRLIFAVLLAACGSSSPPADRPIEFGGDRPTDLKLPAGLGGPESFPASYPLLVVLHGYSASGFVQTAYFGVSMIAAQDQAFLLAPDGLTDSMGHEYWNADPACCDFDHTGVNDSAYIGGLIDDVMAAYPEIDPARVFVLGHSNGGFMAYRMACDRADVISSIGVLAGLYPTTPCTPSRAVNLLHMHGTADEEVPYETAGVGAVESVAAWAHDDGCAATRTTTGMLDLEMRLPGAETTDSTADGCPSGTTVEFWSIAGGGHLPAWNDTFEPMLWAWFTAHHR